MSKTLPIRPTPAALISGALDARDAPRPLSVFDMFRIGVGPSSSHTVGPMRAGLAFASRLAQMPGQPAHITIDLYGSLGATGRGHSTDRAVLLGLAGHDPETVAIETVESLLPEIAASGQLRLADGRSVAIDLGTDVRFLPAQILPYHVNALTITATTAAGETIAAGTYYSVGGGFVMEQTDPGQVRALASADALAAHAAPAPYPYASATELVKIARSQGMSISEVVFANEVAARPEAVVHEYLDRIRETMFACIAAGCSASGLLPGGLDVPRRAATLCAKLAGRDGFPARGSAWAASADDPMRAMDWVNLYALAVNEENAAGHRVVTAPTNGAAGVVPAVLAYLLRFCPEGADTAGASRKFLLAATAIGGLIKTNASIAGAEVGCQGEVGSAAAMAAGGLAEALGGDAGQVENAAEIAMEHCLGLTCDPVGGLVQIPCIERNAIAAVKAINAARMALWGDGRHHVTLDAAIQTMYETGRDMLAKYKETSAGGLAVNVVEC